MKKLISFISLLISSTLAMGSSYLAPLGELIDAPDLYGPWKMAISPDERHLYVSLYGDNGLSWFSINIDGSLDFSGAMRDGSGGVTGMKAPRGLAVSPDGKMVCVASYGDCGLAWFKREQETGNLTFSGSHKDSPYTKNYIALVFSPDGAFVYCCGNNFITWFSVTGGACTLAGSIESRTGQTYALAGASGIAVSPDGKQVYTAAPDINAVAWFSRDTQSGALAASGFLKSATGVSLDGVCDVKVSADGRMVYAAAADDNSIARFTRDTTNGNLTYAEAKSRILSSPVSEGHSAVALGSDGRNVFVASADPGFIYWYSPDSEGRLSYRSAGVVRDRGTDMSCGLVYCNRTNTLYLSSFNEHRIFSFTVDTTEDTVRYTGIAYEEGNTGVDGLDGTTAIAMDPDGERLYVAAYYEQKISWFTRASGNGALTYGGSLRNWNEFTPVMYSTVIVAPDGNNVFGAGNDKVTSFIWDSTGKRLSAGGELTLAGMQGTPLLAMSPDGRHVYASGTSLSKIYRISRNASDGTLKNPLPADEFTSIAGGLGTISTFSISPDARQLYVAFSSDSIIRSLSRDTANGNLSIGTDTRLKRPE